MSEVSDELDRVFAVLSVNEFGLGYNDGTGHLVGEFNYRKEFLISEVDGGAVEPYTVMKEEFAPQIQADYDTLMASGPKEPVFTTEGVEFVTPDPKFVIRGANLYRQELPDNDSYEFWLSITV